MSSDNALNRLRLAYTWLDNWKDLCEMDVVKIRKAIHEAVAAWQIDKEDMRRLSRRVTLLEAQVREMSADTDDRK